MGHAPWAKIVLGECDNVVQKINEEKWMDEIIFTRESDIGFEIRKRRFYFNIKLLTAVAYISTILSTI